MGLPGSRPSWGRPGRLLRPRPMLKNVNALPLMRRQSSQFGSAASLGPTTYLRNVPSGPSTGVGGLSLIRSVKTCVTTRAIPKPGRQNIRQRPARTLRMRSLRTRRETRRPSMAVGWRAPWMRWKTRLINQTGSNHPTKYPIQGHNPRHLAWLSRRSLISPWGISLAKVTGLDRLHADCDAICFPIRKLKTRSCGQSVAQAWRLRCSKPFNDRRESSSPSPRDLRSRIENTVVNDSVARVARGVENLEFWIVRAQDINHCRPDFPAWRHRCRARCGPGPRRQT